MSTRSAQNFAVEFFLHLQMFAGVELFGREAFVPAQVTLEQILIVVLL